MPTYIERSRYHGWLPTHPEVHAEFLRRHVGRYAPNAPAAPAPVAATPELNDLVTDFIDKIKKSEVMSSLFNLIFRQVNKDDKWAPAEENYHVHDLDHLQKALTSAISGPPNVYVVKDKGGNDIGEPIGIPIYLVLDLLINTDAAHDLFRMKEFNSEMKKLLDGWGKYLKGENNGSNSSLDTSPTGWLGKHGLDVLQQGLKGQSFEHTYGVKPEEAQAKYKSWDQFFIRDIPDFKKRRPIEIPDLYTALHNACESTTVRTVHKVKVDDTFWLKGQNYSLYDMFGGDPHTTKESLSKWAPDFVGGSVYQAFLAPQDYHHWHSPIKGTILDTAVIPGTYYAALPDDGASKDDRPLREGDPHGALMRSQPWLSLAAARGVIIMEPQDKSSPIAKVAFIGIGMVEVSTIDIRVSKDGISGPKDVDVGDHLGMFHFGGSSYVVVIKPKADHEVKFIDVEDEPVLPRHHRWVNEIIGRVIPTGQ